LAITSLVAQAASYTTVNFLRGTNFIMYTGTSATTFKMDDAYNTNRTYVNALGTLTIPNATNTVTGALNPSFEKPVQTWGDVNGNAVTNLSVYVQTTETGGFTNTVAVTLVKSADNGNNYPTDDTQSLFTFTFDPVNNGIITNLPSAFLVGAGHIRLWKLVSGSNPGGAGTVVLKQFRLSGYIP
jgi:hypothetical protein